MSEKTNIEWATSTGNPWIGCTKVSPGCKNCYAAELDANRFSKTMGGGTKSKPISHWGKGALRVRTKAFWKDALKWNREAGEAELARCREFSDTNDEPYVRPRIFPSLCDWLDDEVPIEWLADFLKLIHDTPNLDWLLLTKRPGLFDRRVQDVVNQCDRMSALEIWLRYWIHEGNPPPNVWIGVSVEDKPRKSRLNLLRQIPATIHFVSFEPLLEDLELTDEDLEGIEWTIWGGESGKDRRDCGVEALCEGAQKCIERGIATFFKQDCAFKPGQQGRIPDAVWALKQFPKI